MVFLACEDSPTFYGTRQLVTVFAKCLLCSDPEPDKCSPHRRTLCLNPRPPIYAKVIDDLSAVEVFQVNLLDAFAKLRKATISFVVSVRLSVRIEQLGSRWTDFH
jgi:hypothetical protein